jgi:hypothetical protein
MKPCPGTAASNAARTEAQGHGRNCYWGCF